MSDNRAKTAWIKRVLGIEIALAKEEAGRGQLLEIWLNAKDAVDAQIAKLQFALRRYGHPDLDQIADAGLHALTEQKSVGLMVALREADATGADEGKRRKLADAINAYRSFLKSDDVVNLLDANMFSEITMRTTLDGALDTISQRLG